VIKEENKTLHAAKPKQKWRTDAHDELSIHKDIISICACKYGMMIEMFPSSDLLNKRLPESPTLFESTEHYRTASTQESSFMDKPYHHFPDVRNHNSVGMKKPYLHELSIDHLHYGVI
jgi:hypothetical protein